MAAPTILAILLSGLEGACSSRTFSALDTILVLEINNLLELEVRDSGP